MNICFYLKYHARMHNCTIITGCVLVLLSGVLGQRWVQNKGLWYYIPPDTVLLPFFEAQKYCANISAQLATIAFADQNTYLADHVSSFSWLGYYHTADHHCGTVSKYPKWTDDKDCVLKFRGKYPQSQNVPPPYCVALASNGSWTIHTCDKKLSFVCQWQCREIRVHNEMKHKSANGLYTPDSFLNNRTYFKNDNGVYLVWYTSSSTKLWILDVDVNGTTYYYASPQTPDYSPDLWTLPNDWRRILEKANLDFYCETCRDVDIFHEDNIFNGTYTAQLAVDMNETCNGDRSKIYKRDDGNITLYLFVGTDGEMEQWYIGSDNCSEGWVLYNEEYTPLPCMLQGMWVYRYREDTTTEQIPTIDTTTTTTYVTTIAPTTSVGPPKEDFPMLYMYIIVGVLGLLLIVIIIIIIVVCVRKRREPPLESADTMHKVPPPSAGQVNDKVDNPMYKTHQVDTSKGDVPRDSFKDENIFAAHDELETKPEKSKKTKTTKKI